jgi:hypothetical protein
MGRYNAAGGPCAQISLGRALCAGPLASAPSDALSTSMTTPSQAPVTESHRAPSTQQSTAQPQLPGSEPVGRLSHASSLPWK